MAESVAGKIAAMETEERRQGEDFRAWLGQLEDRDRDNSLAEDRQEVREGLLWGSLDLVVAPLWIREVIAEICINLDNCQMTLIKIVPVLRSDPCSMFDLSGLISKPSCKTHKIVLSPSVRVEWRLLVEDRRLQTIFLFK